MIRTDVLPSTVTVIAGEFGGPVCMSMYVCACVGGVGGREGIVKIVV